MEQSTELTPPLLAAPRHLRRRRFRADIPDKLLVADGERHVVRDVRERREKPVHPTPPQEAKSRAYRRKRAVALCGVVVVSLSVPALALALIFAG